jgi:hypothetical protein
VTSECIVIVVVVPEAFSLLGLATCPYALVPLPLLAHSLWIKWASSASQDLVSSSYSIHPEEDNCSKHPTQTQKNMFKDLD